MIEHLSEEQIELYSRRAVPPAELLFMDNHISACLWCRGRLNDMEPLRPALASLLTSLDASARGRIEHLSYEQLAGYARKELGELDLEIVECHVELCLQCARELEDLLAFASRMKASVKRSKTSAEATPSRTFRGRLLALFSPSANRHLVRVAATAAAAVLVIAVTSVLLIEINTSKSPSNPPTGLTGSATPRGPLVIANGAGGPVTVDRRGRATGVDYARVLAVVENIEGWRPSVPESLIAEARTVRRPAGATLSLDSFSPEGTVVLSDRPTFKWPALDGAKGYIVEIHELTQDDETGKKVAASALLSKTEWTVPSALSRGVAYAWQVIGVRADESLMDPQPGSSDEKLRFKVLEKSKADELEIAKRKDANAHLTLGILYTEAGLIEDAEREFEELLRANRESPDAQKFARKLLDRVKEMRTR